MTVDNPAPPSASAVRIRLVARVLVISGALLLVYWLGAPGAFFVYQGF